MRWMKLEPIIQSEVSQKEKHQYSILIYIYGIQNDGNNDSIWEIAKETDEKNRLLDSVGEGEGGVIWENSFKICIVLYVKESKFYAWNRALKAATLVQPREVGWGASWEKGLGWGTHVHPYWFMSMYGKNRHNFVK